MSMKIACKFESALAVLIWARKRLSFLGALRRDESLGDVVEPDVAGEEMMLQVLFSPKKNNEYNPKIRKIREVRGIN